MPAEQLWREGKLDEALADLQAQVRRDPSNPKLRIFLCQLLAVNGDWSRSLNQLQVAGELDAAALAMVQTYREAIQCEVLRGEVFAGKRSPLLFGRPEEWVGAYIEALRLGAEGHHGRAAELLERAREDAPATAGRLTVAGTRSTEAPAEGSPQSVPPAIESADPGATPDEGNAFEWIADADSRIGPILEAVVNGRYYWIPFDRIREVAIEAPADLRDLVWMPAHFRWANGGESVGLIPTRYPGSESAADPRVRLARLTEWREVHAGVFWGLGQRMMVTDVDDVPLMEIRRIRLDTETPEDADAGGEGPGRVPS